MKYIVTMLQNDSVTAAFTYDKKKDALSKFHHEMEYAINADNDILCIVANSNGVILENKKYTAPPVATEGGEDE